MDRVEASSIHVDSDDNSEIVPGFLRWMVPLFEKLMLTLQKSSSSTCPDLSEGSFSGRDDASPAVLHRIGHDPLTDAREALRALQDGSHLITRETANSIRSTDDPGMIADILKASLRRANKDAAALFPAGEKNREEAETAIAKLVEDRYISLARANFRALQEGERALLEAGGYHANDDPQTTIAAMRRALALAHKDAAVLDPTGSRTAAEMERQITAGVIPQEHLSEAEKQRYIATARSEFQMEVAIQHSAVGNPENHLRHIQNALIRAGVDASVLDPEGHRSAEQMNALVLEAYRKANITKARQEFEDIQHGVVPGGASASLGAIRDELAKAGATTAALDATGTRSSAQMTAVLQDAWKQANIERAQFENGDMSYETKGTGMTVTEWERKRAEMGSGENIQRNAEATSEGVSHGLSTRGNGPSHDKVFKG